MGDMRCICVYGLYRFKGEDDNDDWVEVPGPAMLQWMMSGVRCLVLYELGRDGMTRGDRTIHKTQKKRTTQKGSKICYMRKIR